MRTIKDNSYQEGIKPGDLILGNCLESMPYIEPGSVDAVITDLPYGTTRCKWDSVIPLEKLWCEYERLLKPKGVIVLFAGQPFTSALISSNASKFKYCWYWEKEKGTGFLNAKIQPMRTIEEVCIFGEGTPIYNPQMTMAAKPRKRALPVKQSETFHYGVKSIDHPQESPQYKFYDQDYPKNLLKFPRDKGNKGIHPTQKPLALMEYLVKTHTNEGDLVLDNCAGSFTTIVACLNLNRKFIGIENHPTYFDLGIKRISSISGSEEIKNLF